MIKFVLLGNVDSGKSTLAGRILIDTNIIDEAEINKVQRDSEKNKKQSFWLAYLLDIDENERERGITLGYINFPFTFNSKKFDMYDVPGHKDLVQEMTMGASNCNIGLIVLSARKGEYEASIKGQTLEHILIGRGMFTSLIVCINKMDCNEWNLDIYNEIKNDFTKKIKKFRFKNVEFCPISAYTGDNVVIKYDKSPTCSLMDILSTIKIEQNVDKYFEIKNKTLIKTKFIFDNIDNLITSGYHAIAHSKDLYFQIVFRDIKNDKMNFVTNKNIIDENGIAKIIDVDIEFIDKPDRIHSTLIIRSHDRTIGLAKIYQVI